MNKNEYIYLFHKLQLNKVAFKPLFSCDDEVLALVNAALAQRTWVGLTGTEINHIFARNVGYPESMMKDVETLLKDKNT